MIRLAKGRNKTSRSLVVVITCFQGGVRDVLNLLQSLTVEAMLSILQVVSACSNVVDGRFTLRIP